VYIYIFLYLEPITQEGKQTIPKSGVNQGHHILVFSAKNDEARPQKLAEAQESQCNKKGEQPSSTVSEALNYPASESEQKENMHARRSGGTHRYQPWRSGKAARHGVFHPKWELQHAHHSNKLRSLYFRRRMNEAALLCVRV